MHASLPPQQLAALQRHFQHQQGGALAPLVVSPNFAHLRVWEVGWGNVPLDLCGVLVRESRATWLAGARWGLSPGLYR